MIPVRISISGFMSYRDEQSLCFDGAPLWVLSGPNGAGKSTVFDAITFALFGIYRGQKQNITDLVNHQSDKAVVNFDFRLGDTLYRVTRTIKKTGGTTRCAFFHTPASDGRAERFVPIPDTDRDEGFKRWIDKNVGLNYETFITSVLLQQNKSDRLLDADTNDRFKILATLIDLSRYIELETRAKNWERKWKNDSLQYEGQLKNYPPVSDAELASARQRLDNAIQTVDEASSLVSQLTFLYGESQRWNTLDRELKGRREEVTEKRKILEREEEITSGFSRYQSLAAALPTLKSLLDAQKRLARSIAEEQKFQQEIDGLEEPIRQAGGRITKLSTESQEQEQLILSLMDAQQEANRRIMALAPTLNLLSQIDDLEERKSKQTDCINAFPPDLSDQLIAEENKEKQAKEALNAIVWLRKVAKARTELIKSQSLERQLAQERETTAKELAEARKALQNAETAKDLAHKAERDAVMEQILAETRLSEVQQKKDCFDEIAGDLTCRYCGQELTPDHIKKEKARLTQELEVNEQDFRSAKRKHTEALVKLRAAEDVLSSATRQFRVAETALSDLDNQLGQVRLDLPRLLDELREAFAALPPLYQERIAETAPKTIEEWIVTKYPNPGDIRMVEQEASQQGAYHAKVERLREAQNSRSREEMRLQHIKTELAIARGKLPPDAETARLENETACRAQAKAEGELESARKKLLEIKREQKRVENEITGLKTRQATAQNNLSSERARQMEIRTAIEDYKQQLDLVWLPQLGTLDEQQIRLLQNEKNDLNQYKSLSRELEIARQTVDSLSERIEELEKLISEIPEEGRVNPGILKVRLDDAQTAKTKAEKEKSEAEVALKTLMDRKQKRAEVEAQKLAADRKAYLYGILADKLGDQGIQQALINQAEIAIVNRANDVLYNLSAGRWSLELRERGRNKKALDVVVYDAKTGGNNPIPIVLASGSQRFRIAISLALAIGQYIRQESQRIESVIIDEGFGSLDKVGRDDTIQELRNLHQHLEKIILVSHQEEFYGTFPTGYGIDIVDGASKVTLIGR